MDTTNAIQINKGIPTPVRWRQKQLLDIFADLEVGDSFVVPKRSDAQAIYAFGKKEGFGIITRKQRDGSIRIWRSE